MSFQNKVVIVTGASSGIGAAIAIAFAKEGADVAMVGRKETKLATVEDKCKFYGKPPLVIKADVTKDDDVKMIIETVVDKFGKLDILVNNAGIAVGGTIIDGTVIEAFDEMIATNLRASILLTALASPHLINTKGNIINISGVTGHSIFNIPQILPLCIMKAALNHFTLGSAFELSTYGVRVNAVSPGPVYTDMVKNHWDSLKQLTALDRVSEPEEIADLVMFLASDKAKGITGSNYVSDNGMLLKKN